MSDGTVTYYAKFDISNVEAQAAKLQQLLNGSNAALNKGVQFGPTQQDTGQVVAYANAQARLVQLQNTGKNALAGLIQAEQIYQQALSKVNVNSIEAIRLQQQLQTVQNRISNISGGGLSILPRSLENFGPQALQQIQQGLLGIVGPAALVTAGFGAVKGAIDLTEESFKLKAALDTTNLSIQLQLKNFRDVNQTLQDGRQFAARYAITQRENAEAIQASIPLLRQSKASLSDVEGVLARLAVLKPEQGIQGAAFALAELEGGQSRSLATRFNVPIAQATELKNRIKDGGDAIQVMDEYLNSVGLDMSTLDTRTQGATGKMNQLKVETENFQLALGGQAGGPGLALLNARIDATRGATRVLSGDFIDFGKSVTGSVAEGNSGLLSFLNVLQPVARLVQQMPGFTQIGEEAQRRSNQALQDAVAAGERKSAVDDAVTAGVQRSALALDEDAQKKLADKIETAQLAQQQKQLETDSYAAANGLLGAGNQADLLAQKYGIAARQAQFLINAQQQLSNATALADQRKGEQTGTDLTAAQFDKFGKIARQGDIDRAAAAKRDADKARQDARALIDSEIGLAGAKKNTAREIELLRQKQSQLDRTTVAGQAEFNSIEAQIIGIQTAGGRKRVDAAASTALQLQNTEQNNQLALAKIQREGLERLRDQEQDYDLKRTRSKEDEDEKIRSLLAHGQRAQAAKERADFEKGQRREAEDFNIQRQRTLRNNAEQGGDQNNRTDLRQTQIGNRAALRGVRTNGDVALPTQAGGGASPTSVGGGQRLIQVTLPSNLVTPDGQVLANITYPYISARLDDDLSIEIRGANPPGSNQTAIAGSRP